MADAENEESSGEQKEEDQPIRARVRYTYPDVSTATPNESAPGKELQNATEEVNPNILGGKLPTVGLRRAKEPIGTRLTMTSRTGFFQDRIVSPSMVCLLLKI